MTEQQIKDGYERLDGGLAPPLDAPDRIWRRMRTRRLRRRAAVGGVAAFAVAAVAAGAAGAAGRGGAAGPGRQIAAAGSAAHPRSTLVMTRPDGSTYVFEDVTVTCERPPMSDEPTTEGQIYAYSPLRVEHGRVAEPYFYFRGRYSQIRGDQTFEFPNDWEHLDGVDHPVTISMVDPAAEGRRGNKVDSTTEWGTRGTVRVVEASCDPVPVLRLKVDTTLGTTVRARAEEGGDLPRNELMLRGELG